ncbi:MAG: hypothetical protein QOJ09_196, partial [Actinomycetota bacterium]|nr:hypothetical protein [Actinomycetota bacterium]
IVAEGPKLGYDSRNGNIRTSQGQVQAGLSYTVTAATLPSVADLQKDTSPIPPDIRRFTRVPSAPPAVADLMDKAKAAGPDKWSQFDFARNYVLDTVVAAGVGAPKSVTPERVQAVLGSSHPEASPYEIVAIQALIARWMKIPSRIGYGFDGGDDVSGKLQVRPRNGATFVEVYFPGFKWLPVIGTPRQAKASVNRDPSQQQFDPTVLPSNDITVQVFLPLVQPPGSIFAKQLQRAVLLGIPIVLLLVLLYVLFPAVRKAWLRSRRRSAALAMGPRAQVALAYAEWRDVATDFGFDYPNDTPLMYLDRFVDDPEHTELAWLVTRALWGDLQHDIGPALVTSAQELSRALRRRLGQSQPATVRAVALVSRLSLRHPFAPDLNRLLTAKEGHVDVHAA